MTFINLTPHAIVVVDTDGNTHTFPPSGQVARVNQNTTPAADIGNFSVNHLTNGDLIAVPAPQADTIFVVSAMVAQATDRTDIVAPNTAQAVRNDKGHVVSVPGFVQFR